MGNTDLFAERVVQAAARSGRAVSPHLVPSTTYSMDAADGRWLSMCTQLLFLARQANSVLDSAGLGSRIVAEVDASGRNLTLRCGDRWLRLKRQKLIDRGHVTVERSYRLPPYPPEPPDLDCLEDLVFELVSTGPAPAR
ncbi:MAG TPA: hypothetical protein VFN68_03010 [Acidimicrobiales bacterium]|nr:hypothetical protein [Acidimicrobiales bacterium]